MRRPPIDYYQDYYDDYYYYDYDYDQVNIIMVVIKLSKQWKLSKKWKLPRKWKFSKWRFALAVVLFCLLQYEDDAGEVVEAAEVVTQKKKPFSSVVPQQVIKDFDDDHHDHDHDDKTD